MGFVPITSLRSPSSSKAVRPMLSMSRNARAFALVEAIRIKCLATLELQFCGLESPISENVLPSNVFTVALQIAVYLFSSDGN